ncbi:hypothetical protein M758_4G037300 [Ceratodon purpureus]|uniref:Cytochrome b561 and DOMON domain-containing protein n=1 Tax=Ceratodon purpureus TaxID=3225 RepID=A0A8T0I6D6_CERPU|nr:hypothetical protein KC19_4G040600 [Ceratodon purpureus]KAG0618081.1 hypothetical protein M758_4G037300 [Ceratodon purpureus]
MAKDMRSRDFGASKLAIWLWCVAITVLSLALPASSQGCNTDLTSKVTKFSTANLLCKNYPVGANQFYIWALKDNATQVTSIVYAAPLTTNYWAGLGFSADGTMVGSTALISTLNDAGVPVATVYSLNGRSTSQVVATGNGLSFVGGPPGATYDQASQTVYVSMQVDFANSTAKPTFLLMAYGRQLAGGQLAQHDSRISTSAQFLSGVVAPPSAASTLDHKAKIHGSLNILGWGLLLPIGAMVARYGRGFDPAWFYTHIAFQITGFACIIAGVATGVELTKDIQPKQLNGHRGLGIFIFALAILQVLAVVLRPKKDAKVRKYWNWYHHWVGRLALFLAVINIFVGLKMGNAERDFKVGYISILAIELVAFVILEILLWLRWNRQRPSQQTSPPEDQAFQFGGGV